MIVYCIKNKVNEKEYIGLTTRKLQNRWKQHIYESKRENSWEWNTPLRNAIKKYGEENFEVFVLKECSSLEELKQKEIECISERKSFVRLGGYNMTKGGDGRLGCKHSEETKRKIGSSSLGRMFTEETKEKCRIAKKGKYTRGKHPKSVKLLINGNKIFNCIRDFSDFYGIPCSTINNKFRKGLLSFELKGLQIQKVSK
jgi:group I intron endonuclease